MNALSQWLEVQVQKDGRIYEMKFSRGEISLLIPGVCDILQDGKHQLWNNLCMT